MTNPGVVFGRLRLGRWRQFGDVDLEFHPRLTVLTGANGSGKSTILGVLAQHFGWSRTLVATPVPEKAGGYIYVTDAFKLLDDNNDRLTTVAPSPSSNLADVGELTYSNGCAATLFVPKGGPPEYRVELSGQAPVIGAHVDSHRRLGRYQRVERVPAEPMLPELAFQQWWQEVLTDLGGSYSQSSPLLRIKEALIAMAVFGEGNRHAEGNPVVVDAFRGFVDVLRKILPPSLGFQDIVIRSPEVVLKTRTGDWTLDAASGGVMTLIELAWQIFMYAHGKTAFVVTLDEPENHLHPSMQRTLMRDLVAAFPRVQFVIATHSPFVVSSVRDSNVYVLRYAPAPEREASASLLGERDRWVESVRLPDPAKVGTAGDILRDVLGVPATIPEWVEGDLDGIVARYRDRPFTTETLSSLRTELSALGLDELYPDALAGLSKGR